MLANGTALEESYVNREPVFMVQFPTFKNRYDAKNIDMRDVAPYLQLEHYCFANLIHVICYIH
jgi:hypothetical protein